MMNDIDLEESKERLDAMLNNLHSLTDQAHLNDSMKFMYHQWIDELAERAEEYGKVKYIASTL